MKTRYYKNLAIFFLISQFLATEKSGTKICFVVECLFKKFSLLLAKCLQIIIKKGLVKFLRHVADPGWMKSSLISPFLPVGLSFVKFFAQVTRVRATTREDTERETETERQRDREKELALEKR